MSFLKGPIRAHRLSKSLTQAFSTCQAPWEEEKAQVQLLMGERDRALWDLWCTRGPIMWHVHRTHSRHVLPRTPQQATVTTEVPTHPWAPATESAWGRQYCLEVRNPFHLHLLGLSFLICKGSEHTMLTLKVHCKRSVTHSMGSTQHCRARGKSSMHGNRFYHLNYYHQSCFTEEPADNPSEKWRRVEQLVIPFGPHSQARADGSLDRWHLFLKTISGKLNQKV